MPYASEKQANLMRAVAHSPSFAKKVGIPQSVGRKFEGHKAEGGDMKMSPAKKAMEMRHAAALKKAGKPKMAAEEMKEAKGYAKGGGVESKGKTRGKIVKMMGGGSCK